MIDAILALLHTNPWDNTFLDIPLKPGEKGNLADYSMFRPLLTPYHA